MDTYNLGIYGHNNSIDSFPLVRIFGVPSYYIEALENVYDIIYSSSFHCEFPCALIQVQDILGFSPVKDQEPFAKLAETLLFPVIRY